MYIHIYIYVNRGVGVLQVALRTPQAPPGLHICVGGCTRALTFSSWRGGASVASAARRLALASGRLRAAEEQSSPAELCWPPEKKAR